MPMKDSKQKALVDLPVVDTRRKTGNKEAHQGHFSG